MGTQPPIFPDRPFTFEQSTEEHRRAAEYLHIDRADSTATANGGSIALLIGIRHPERVRKLIIESAMYKRDWTSSRVLGFDAACDPESMPQELQEGLS